MLASPSETRYTVPYRPILDGVTKGSKMNLIAYRRVSTARQGASGLGLEGQEAAVAEYARAIGKSVLRAYTGVPQPSEQKVGLSLASMVIRTPPKA